MSAIVHRFATTVMCFGWHQCAFGLLVQPTFATFQQTPKTVSCFNPENRIRMVFSAGPLGFASWSFVVQEFNLTIDEGRVGQFLFSINEEFDLTHLIGENVLATYTAGDYTEVYFTLRFSRRVMYYVWSLIAPCFMIGFCTLFTFKTPVEAGEKITSVYFSPNKV